MKIEPVDGSFAVEVKDLPLWDEASSEDATAIRAAYRDAGVMVFRRQALSEDELLRFGKMIGSPSIYAETAWLSTQPEVIILSNMRGNDGELLGGLANNPLTWHTDQSYYAKPVTGCFLYGVELPATGGQTSWASLYHAYDTLPAELKGAVDGAVGTFSFAARIGPDRAKSDNHDMAKRLAETPDVKHPLLNINPITGQKALYIDPNTVTGIDGMPQDEADDLLDRLLAHTVQPGNVYDHDWRPGDLVLWDNAVALHKREGFPNECNRLVKRMIITLDPSQHIIPPVVA
jgi:taurine dioxygenase